MMKRCKDRHSIGCKALAVAVLCLFFVNTFAWAIYPENRSEAEHTLRPQSIFQPLRDAGIRDSTELVFEIFAGIRLLHAGKTSSAVNGILTETYRDSKDKRKIEFLSDIERTADQTIARFKVVGKNNIAFEIRYQDTKTVAKDRTKIKSGDEISAIDAGLNKTAPIEMLTYGNVFQARDIVSIRKITSSLPAGNAPPAKTDRLKIVTLLPGSNAAGPDGGVLEYEKTNK